MKYLLFILFIIAYPFSFCQAQTNEYAKMAKQEKLGTTNWTCVYEHKVYDPVMNKTEIYRQILQSSDAISLYHDYSDYQIDSVVNLHDRNKVTIKDASSIYSKYRKNAKKCIIIKDFKKNILSESAKVFTDSYVYKEEMPTFVWEKKTATNNICGFICKEATTTFRGRTWNVWYSEEIPQKDGPWKFSGLSGMILKAESEDKEISFEAIWVEKQTVDILNDIRQNDYKTSREKLLKMQKTYSDNSKQIIQTISEVREGALKNRRRFFNPIETDIVSAK